MSSQHKTTTLATGFAIFSMFFGAGNIVFPLEIGKFAQDQNFYAMLGLLITAIGVPFLGLTAMTLFDGNYKSFFDRMGKIPGFLMTIALMGLIGPFGATPRCITLSYSTVKLYAPDVSLILFSLLSCLVIFAFTFKKNKILDLLAYYLTPFLLISLGIIMVKGLWDGPSLPPSDHAIGTVFKMGFVEGYQTMDLLGAFFFSSVVMACLKQEVNPSEKSSYKKLIMQTLKAGCFGVGLIALAYAGFSYVAASFSNELTAIPGDQLIAAIAVKVLGPYAGFIVCFAVAMACVTTAIALVAIFAEFIQIDVLRNRINYATSLTLTLIATFLVSTLDFTGIKMLLFPILKVCYPALIVLSICNILHKTHKVKVVKTPVYIALFIGILASFM